jgi:predicted metal-binding membrane protein
MSGARSLAGGSLIEQAFRKERLLAVFGLFLATALAWGYLLAGAGMSMHEMDGMLMATRTAPWSPADTALMLAMWAVMMAAMMLPSAAPMILLFATIEKRRHMQSTARGATAIFASGYLIVWVTFSFAATAVQYGLEELALLTPMMQTTSTTFAASVLIAAGLYQWTPFKQACLRRCRSPLDFILGYWREGTLGALSMGVRHGLFCLGCCWMLMALLFVGGVMNLLWVALLSVYILIEKLVPAQLWITRISGAALILWGTTILMNIHFAPT